MSKAALAIQSMIDAKEQELNQYIRNNKEVLIPYANLRSELADLKQKRYDIAINRIQALTSDPNYDLSNDDLTKPVKNINGDITGYLDRKRK